MFPATAGKKELARKLRAQGNSVPEIARTVGMAEATVRGWVRDIPPSPRVHRMGTERAKEVRDLHFGPVRERARQMRGLGLSCKEIARVLDVTPTTVSLWTAKPRTNYVKVPPELKVWNRKMRRAGVSADERRRLIAEARRTEQAA